MPIHSEWIAAISSQIVTDFEQAHSSSKKISIKLAVILNINQSASSQQVSFRRFSYVWRVWPAVMA